MIPPMLPWWLERVLGLEVRRPDADTFPRPLLKTRRQSLAAHPDGVVSAVLSRLVERGYGDLAVSQRRAWLLATYDLAVRNSGHAEYFRTFGVGRAAETRRGLEELGAKAPRDVLDEAIRRHVSTPGETGARVVGSSRRPWSPPRFEDLDAAYRGMAEEVAQAVRREVQGHFEDFVAVEE
jgi:hypothetical protein